MNCHDYFFFNDPAPTEIYTLSLHDALPISGAGENLLVTCENGDYAADMDAARGVPRDPEFPEALEDRKSTRLNSSHTVISYAVFCLKKKITTNSDAIKQVMIISKVVKCRVA